MNTTAFRAILLFMVSAAIGACGNNSPSFSKLTDGQARTGSDNGASKTGDKSGDDPEEACDRAGIEQEADTVKICHVPSGNPAAKHTICPSRSGATNGHGLDLSNPAANGGHGGDKVGPC